MEKRTVEVTDAAVVKRKARRAKRVVTQLPQRLQMAKKPTTISAMVTMNAMRYAMNIHLETVL